MLKKDRIIRKKRIKDHVLGTGLRPRVAVFRSNKYVYAQAVDDAKSVTLVSVSEKSATGKNKKERAMHVGQLLAEKLLAAKIKEVVFDRSGYRYHGRVQAVAEGLRDKGLKV